MPARKRHIYSDLKRIDQLKDEDIDYSDAPPLTDEFLKAPLVHIAYPKEDIKHPSP